MTNTVRLAPLARRDQQVVLNPREQLAHVLTDGIERDRTLLARIATHEHALVLVDVARTELHAKRHAAQLPLVVLRARLDTFAVVDVHAQTARIATLPLAEHVVDLVRRFEDTIALFIVL